MGIADGDHTPPGSCVRYFAKCVGRDVAFSPRLWRVIIRAIERVWRSELKVSALGTTHLLNCLDVGLDDTAENRE